MMSQLSDTVNRNVGTIFTCHLNDNLSLNDILKFISASDKLSFIYSAPPNECTLSRPDPIFKMMPTTIELKSPR